MSEDRETEISASQFDLEAINEALDQLYKKLILQENESTISSEGVFQQLLRKFQQLLTSKTDHRNRFHQGILLCRELIDAVAKTTSVDFNDFQNCLQLFREMEPEYTSSVLTEDEKLFTRKIFFELLDLLSKPQICRYLNENQYTKVLHNEFYQMLTNVLLTVAASTITDVFFTNDDIAIRKYTNTFCAMYKRMKHDLDLHAQTEQRLSNEDLAKDCILSFFWNFSDRTIVVPWLLSIDLVKTMLQCLQITYMPSKIAHSIINIIYNISRHDDGADELNTFGGLNNLKVIQNKNIQQLSDFDNLVMSMAIAQLSTTEQIRSDNKRMNRILNQLLQVTIDAAKAKNHRNVNRLHVSEPLAVFTKLFVDDHSLEYVLNHAETDPQLTVSSTIALFVDLLIEFRGAFAVKSQLAQFTCTALLNILWSISFQDRYKTKLKQTNGLLKTIKNLVTDNSEQIADQYVPRSMESMANAASGILYNLNEIPDDKKVIDLDRQLVSNGNNSKPMIMISYAHDNNQFCDKILIELEKDRNLFDIWIDRNHCSSNEDLWEKIARGIGQSKLVVCLLSLEYFNSKSCRKEVTFSIKRQKPIIPVYFGEPGDCDWLDIHIAGLKYVRFKNNTAKLDPGKVQEMLRTIDATMKETQIQPSQQQMEQHSIPTQPRKEVERIKSATVNLEKAPEEWTRDDIQKWFSSHNVPDTLVKLFDFQSIVEMNKYASKLQADSKNEFLKYRQRYAKNYAGEELEEYMFDRFKNALLKLRGNQPETMKLSTSFSETIPPKSSTCTIL